MPGAEGITGDRHPLDHQVGEFGEQDAVLEGAGLALVGIAHDVVLGADRFAGQAPLHAGREPGATAAAKLGGGDFRDHLVRRTVERCSQPRDTIPSAG